MELKEFIEAAISDIVKAVKSSQEDLKDTGAIICPNNMKDADVNSKEYGGLKISNIGFEVKVSISDKTESSKGGGIKVASGFLGVDGGGKKATSTGNENVSSVSFSIPVILPFVKVEEGGRVKFTRTGV